MKSKWIGFSIAILIGALLALPTTQAQVIFSEDFEGPLPGPQEFPNGYSFFGGGLANPVTTLQITDTESNGGLQSFQIDIDSSNNVDSYFYGGFGGFLGFFGTEFGAGAGQPGNDDPANYDWSFDLKVQGNDGDTAAATPLGGVVGLFKSDYEAVYGVDANNDGDMEDGFNIWETTFEVAVADNNWNTVTLNLDAGSAPTAPNDPAPIVPITPTFDDESTIYFQLNFNSGGFGTDAGNVINIDNMQLEFTSPADPADLNQDTFVDGLDLGILLGSWGTSTTPDMGELDGTPPVDGLDLGILLGAWNPPPAVATAAIPEPSAIGLGFLMMGILLSKRQRV